MNRVLFTSKSILTTSTLKRFYSHNISKLLEPYTKNKKIINWIQETSDLCGPKDVKICDGSIEEYNTLIEEMLQKKTITKVKKRENCYLGIYLNF
jgi:GTP-dependent phosphoenolpyruvate carboxykinase